jgi:N-acetyl-anhydromuramyl-L-alanine amidase AmpD
MDGSYLGTSETVGREQVLTWMEEYAPIEFTDEASALDWIQGILGGAVPGVAQGAAMGGPWGALVGGLVGGGLGAAQTALQASRPASQPPVPPPVPPPPSPLAASAPPPAPASPAPIPASGLAGISPELLQQIAMLLPLLAQLVRPPAPSPNTGPARLAPLPPQRSTAGRPAIPEEQEDSEEPVFDAWESDGRDGEPTVADPGDAERGIEGPLPSEEDPSAASQAPEYPLAARFVPAAPGNYGRYVSTRSAPHRPIRRIVIHITDGGANINGTVSHFSNPESGVSAHYIVGQDGEIVQMVRHNDIAYHAHGANTDSIGVEHVARVPGALSRPAPGMAGATWHDPGLYPTAIQYCSSAALVRWLCEQYGIPIDRAHILGHAAADPRTSHRSCPDAVWNWDYYMRLVTSGACLPEPSLRQPAQERPTVQEDIAPRARRVGPGALGLEVTEWTDEAALELASSDGVLIESIAWRR